MSLGASGLSCLGEAGEVRVLGTDNKVELLCVVKATLPFVEQETNNKKLEQSKIRAIFIQNL